MRLRPISPRDIERWLGLPIGELDPKPVTAARIAELQKHPIVQFLPKSK